MTSRSRSPKAALHPRIPATIPVSFTTGNAVMKGRRSKFRRAIDAAKDVAGVTDIKPTIAMAARAEKVSEYLVRQALTQLRIPTPTQAAVAFWDALPEADRDSLIRVRQHDIWTGLDRITSPSPSIAA